MLCVRFDAAVLDLPLAEAYLQAIRSIRDGERHAIARAGGLRIYQDLRSLSLIERAARAYLLEGAWKDLGRWSIVYNKVQVASLNPLLRTAIQVIGSGVTQMGLPPVQLTPDLLAELERDGIRAPSHGS